MPGMTQVRPPSVPAPVQPDLAAGPRLRPYGAALVPLALAGLLPWWAVALLCVLFGLGARFPVWQDARLLVSLLVAGVATLPELAALRGNGNGEALLDLGARYLALVVALGLSGYGVATLEGGRRRGLIALLCAGLFAPQPLLLPALVGGALLRPGTDDRLGRYRPRAAAEREAERRGWGLLLAAVLALTLLALALPRSGAPSPRAEPAAAISSAPATVRPPQAGAPALTEAARRAAPTASAGGLPPPPAELLLLGAVLTFTALGALLWQRRQGRGPRQPPILTELLMAGGLLLTLGLLLIFSLAGTRVAPGDSSAALPPALAGGPTGRPTTAEPGVATSGFSALLWVVLAVQLLLAAALIWVMWCHRPGPDRLGVVSGSEETADVPVALEAVPTTHRVRTAYRQAGEALAAAGWGRAPAEAPGAYAARLGRAHPGLAAPLDLLTRLYGPVRYGGRVSEAEATEAEAAAAEIAAQAARLLPPPDPSERPKDLP
ncbi:hypothetical protein ASF71_09800 [Deinococcus sp. Leaf326]|nr:hypothetical protein ASF71_09800 [Deinococcus sp. Leaf326]